MAKIYKRSDRITVKIDDITIKLAPLTLDQKTEIQQSLLQGRNKGDLKELTRGLSAAIRYSLKGIEGVEDSDGNAYKLEFDGEGLTDASVDDLMNLELTRKLALVCSSMVNGVPSEFMDVETNKAMQGVEILKTEKVEVEKKN